MKSLKKAIYLFLIFIAAVFITAVLVFVYPKFFFLKKETEEAAPTTYQENKVYFSKQKLNINVEVAKDPYAWIKGLMFREFMPKNSGMLFIFPDEVKRTFWMKNTLIPLDIIFISKDKKIVDIKENFEPCLGSQMSCPSYFPTSPAMYVLEVNAGIVKENGLEIGDDVEL